MKLVVADDHKRLRAAAFKVFNASQQRCQVHWMRNALVHAGPKQRPAVVAMLKTIFAQETKETAPRQWRQVTEAVSPRFPKLAELMDASRDDTLEQNDEWAVARRYMTLETLNPMSDDPMISLPAVAV